MLVVAHPGHELRVFGWMAGARPVVHVLTDGSGSDGVSRLASTTAVIESVGAARGTIYGRLSDREIYRAMLEHDHGLFIALAEELAAGLVGGGAALVAGDAVEGFNPSHDVCRYIINAAVRLAAGQGHHVASYAFPLDGAPDAAGSHGEALRIELDDETLERKLRAAHDYTELRGEVASALARFGREPFRIESLSPVDPADRYGLAADVTPYYETYGRARVAAGAYGRVVTFSEHLKALADVLWERHVVKA